MENRFLGLGVKGSDEYGAKKRWASYRTTRMSVLDHGLCIATSMVRELLIYAKATQRSFVFLLMQALNAGVRNPAVREKGAF